MNESFLPHVSSFPSMNRKIILMAVEKKVVWILHFFSKKEGLPWHCVVNRQGAIFLKPGAGYEKQKEMLKREGIVFDERDWIDFIKKGQSPVLFCWFFRLKKPRI